MGSERRGGVEHAAAKGGPRHAGAVQEGAGEEQRAREEPFEPAVLTRLEAAVFLRVSLRTMDRLPVPRVKLGHRTVRYLRADLEAYLAEHREVDAPVASTGRRGPGRLP